MANVNAPRGLIPYSYVNGTVWNGAASQYFIPSGLAQNIFIGDPVAISHANSDANGVPGITAPITPGTTAMIGVFLGIVDGGPQALAPITVTRDLPIYHPASTAQYCLVADDPNLLFWVQDDGTTNVTNTNASQWAGLNANLVTGGGGSTVTGYSSFQLGASTVATTNTLDVKIIRMLNQSDNSVGTTGVGTNSKWLVRINRHTLVNQTAGA